MDPDSSLQFWHLNENLDIKLKIDHLDKGLKRYKKWWCWARALCGILLSLFQRFKACVCWICQLHFSNNQIILWICLKNPFFKEPIESEKSENGWRQNSECDWANFLPVTYKLTNLICYCSRLATHQRILASWYGLRYLIKTLAKASQE